MQTDNEITLVCLLRVKLDELPKPLNTSRLPAVIGAALADTIPEGVLVGDCYVVDRYRSAAVAVNKVAQPYHKYAVDTLGDPCELPGCDQHAAARTVPRLRLV